MRFFVALFCLAAFHVCLAEEITFRWLDNVEEDHHELLIRVADDDDDSAYIARLRPYNPEALGLKDKSESEKLCIYEGDLEDEADSFVTLTGGCRGEDSFDISFASSSLGYRRFSVRQGRTTEVDTRELEEMANNIVKTLKGPEMPISNAATLEERQQALRSLPTAGFAFKLAMFYDPGWLAQWGNQMNSANSVRRIVAQAQLVFKYVSLTVPIYLNIVNIGPSALNFSTCAENVYTFGDFCSQFAVDPNNADINVGFSLTGSYAGITYQPAVCGPKAYRVALVKYTTSDLTSGNVLAQVLGNTLGMPKDYLGGLDTPKRPRLDSNGQSCTNIGGIMDDFRTASRWTQCSIYGFTEHYSNVLLSTGQFCLTENPTPLGTRALNGNWGEWSGFTSCSVTCGRGYALRSRNCDSPAPLNGGLACPGGDLLLYYCYAQTCPTQMVAMVIGGAYWSSVDVYSPAGGCSWRLRDLTLNAGTYGGNQAPIVGLINTRAVVCGNFGHGRCYWYDQTNDLWNTLTNYNTTSVGFGLLRGTMYLNKIYLFGSGIDCYNGNTNTWNTLPLPGFSIGYDSCIIGINNFIYAIGTNTYSNNGTLFSVVNKLDLNTNTWTTSRVPPAPVSVYGPACTLIPNAAQPTVLLAAGFSFWRSPSFYFFPNRETWETLPDLRNIQNMGSLLTIGSRVFLAGGMLPIAEEFNYNAKVWNELPARQADAHLFGWTGAVSVLASWFSYLPGACPGVPVAAAH